MPRLSSLSQKSLSTPTPAKGLIPKRIFTNPNIYSVDGQGDQFGSTVAVNDKYVIVQAPSEDTADQTSVGRIYKFDLSTGELLNSWLSPAYEASIAEGAVFGMSFGRDLYIHKNLLYIGSNEVELVANTPNWGTVFVYDIDTDQLVAIIPNPETTGDFFGSEIHATDNYVVIGAYGWDAPGDLFNAGRAYVYYTNNNPEELWWTRKHTLTAPTPQAQAFFGNAVAISADYIVVASYSEGVANSDGTVYVHDTETGSVIYTLNSPNLNDPENTASEFGRSVALSGNWLAVGAPGEDYGGFTNQGRVFIYDLTTGSLAYTLDNNNTYDTPAGDQFGLRMSVHNDILAVSAVSEDSDLGTQSGRVSLYSISTGEFLLTVSNPSTEVKNNKNFGGNTSVFRDNVVIGHSGGAAFLPPYPEYVYFYKLRGLVSNVPSYTFATTSVDEGIVNDVVFNVSNISLENGTELFWTIASNAAEFDLPISGNFIINNNTGVIPVKPRADRNTENPETFTIEVRANTDVRQVIAVSDPITINDTSQDPTYTLTSSTGTVADEGETFTVTLTTTDVPDGTVIPYTIISSPSGTSITALDLTAGTMAGSFTINSNSDTVTFTINADETTEGNEYLYLALNNGEAAIDIRIADTSTYPTNWVDVARDVVILEPNTQVSGVSPSSQNGPYTNVKSININRVPGNYTAVTQPNVSGLNFTGDVGGTWTLSFWTNGLLFPTINTTYPFLTLESGAATPETITIGYFPNPSVGNSGRLGLQYGTAGSLNTLTTTALLGSGWTNIVLTYNVFGELEIHSSGIERAQVSYNIGTIDRIIYGGRGTVSQVTGDPTAPADFEIAEVVLRAGDNFGSQPNAGTFVPTDPAIASFARGSEVIPTDKIYQVYATDNTSDPTNNLVTTINETTNNTVSFAVVCTNVTTDNGAPITVSWSLNGIALPDIDTIDGVAVNSASDLSGTLDILNLDQGYVGNFITVVVRDDLEADGTEIMTLNIGNTDSEGDQTGSPSASVTITDTGQGPIDERNLLQPYSNGYYLGTFTDPSTSQSYALVGDSAVGLEFSYNDWDADGTGSFVTQASSDADRLNSGFSNSYVYFDSTDYPLVRQFTSATLNGTSDWYLPSLYESELIATLARTVDLGDQTWPNRTRGYTSYGQSNNHFITSSEQNADNIYYVDFEKSPYVSGDTIPKNGKSSLDYLGTNHVYYAVRRVPISRNLNPTFTVANGDFNSALYETAGTDELRISVDVTQMHVISYALITGGNLTWKITLTNSSAGYTRQIYTRGYSAFLGARVLWDNESNPVIIMNKTGEGTDHATPSNGETFDTIQFTNLLYTDPTIGEQLINGDFSSTDLSAYTVSDPSITATVTNNQLVVDGTGYGFFGIVSQTFDVVQGETYTWTAEIVSSNRATGGEGGSIDILNTGEFGPEVQLFDTVYAGAGIQTGTFTASSSSTSIRIITNNGATNGVPPGGLITVDNLSIIGPSP